MTKLETINKVKELAELLSKLEVLRASARIVTSNDAILKLAAAELNCHVYEPYEFVGNEERQFHYQVDNITIFVLSPEKFRKEVILKAY